jgi:phospholipid/cholesterol/gamma-HCH transport system substrate-binding protein
LKISDEFKVGVLATFALLTLVLGYTFLRGNNPFESTQSFYVVYPKISGVSNSDPVLVNGYKVGKVKNITMMPDIRKGFIAELQVKKGVQIPKNSVARIISADLLGSKAIEIFLSESDIFINSGDTLVSDVQLSLTEEVKLEVLPVKQKATELMESLDSLVTIVKVILNKGQIESSMNSIENATDEFALVAKNLNTVVTNEAASIHDILKNVDAITKNLKNNDEGINKILKNVGTLTDSLNKAELPILVENLNTTLQELKTTLETINKGEGTAGLLIKERETYDLINKTIADLDKVFIDLKENPKRYVSFSVFGKDPDKKKKK